MAFTPELTGARSGERYFGRLAEAGWVMFGGLFALSAVALWLLTGLGNRLAGLDFTSFWATSWVLLAHGPAAVYDLSAQEQAQLFFVGPGVQPFLPDVYPPYWVLARGWLALLPMREAYLAWGALSLIAGAAALLVMGWLIRSWPALVVAAGFPPLGAALLAGQPDSFILLGTALALWLWEKEHELAAGIALALILIKPQLGLPLLALPLIRRSWRCLAGLAGASALLAIVSLAVFGAGGIVAWLRDLGAEGTLLRAQLSLRGPLLATGLSVPLQYLVLALAGIAVMVALAWRRPGLRASFAAACAAGLLVAPHVNFHDLSLLIVPGLLLAGPEPRRRLLLAAAYLGLVAALWLPPLAWLIELALIAAALTRESYRLKIGLV